MSDAFDLPLQKAVNELAVIDKNDVAVGWADAFAGEVARDCLVEAVNNHDKLVELLSKLIEPAGMHSQMLRNHPGMAFMANKIENDVNNTINLLRELGHEI